MTGRNPELMKWVALVVAAIVPAMIVAGLASASVVSKWNRVREDFRQRVNAPQIENCTLETRNVEISADTEVVLFVALNPRFIGWVEYTCNEATDTNYIAYKYFYQEKDDEWLRLRTSVGTRTGEETGDGTETPGEEPPGGAAWETQYPAGASGPAELD